MIQGTKDTYKDMSWLAGLYRKKQKKYFTGLELRENYRILYDSLKFLPFSFFLIVPFSELFLPFYLMFLPNSIPTWYIFDHKWDNYIEQLEHRQKSAHETLVIKLRDFLLQQGMKSEDFISQAKYKQHFVQNISNLDKQLNYNQFASDELIEVCKFLGIEYITGTFIISTALQTVLNSPRYLINLGQIIIGSKTRLKFNHWIFNWDIKLNFFPFEFFKKKLLLFQINRHLNRLKKQDISFYKYGMHDVVGHLITDIARERGITTISCYETLKVFIQNEWISMCLKLNNNQTLFYALMQYDFLQKANAEFN